MRASAIYSAHHFRRQIYAVSKRLFSRWRWLAIQHRQFPARKDRGDDATGSFAAFVHFFFH
jgi:hypothetical protein